PEQRFQKPADLVAELAFLFGTWSGPTPLPANAVALPHPVIDQAPAAEPVRAFADESSSMPATMCLGALAISPPEKATVAARGAAELALTGIWADGSQDEDAQRSAGPHDTGLTLPTHPPGDAEAVTAVPLDDGFRQSWAQWLTVIEAVMAGTDPGIRESSY